jgi:hypothetical protein
MKNCEPKNKEVISQWNIRLSAVCFQTIRCQRQEDSGL